MPPNRLKLLLSLILAGFSAFSSDTALALVYLDADGDGYGDPATGVPRDRSLRSSHTKRAGDCDDSHPARHPGAAEVCDFIDNDCDRLVDEGLDQDGDGWTTCEGDCDDASDDIHPAAAEDCSDVDRDCDRVALSAGCVEVGRGFHVREGVFLRDTHFDIQAGNLIGDEAVDLIAFAQIGRHWTYDPRLFVFEGPISTEGPAPDPSMYIDFTPLSPRGDILVTDVSADGVDDLLLVGRGASPDRGILIWFGPLAEDFDPWVEPDVRLSASPLDPSGIALHAVGDVTGDGWDDLILTQRGFDHLIPGPFDRSRPIDTDRIRIDRTGPNAGFLRVAGGDIDGDGFGDLIQGDAPSCDRNYYICSYEYPSRARAGRVHILRGPITSDVVLPDDTDILLEGEEAWDYAGSSLSADADLNGDGFIDLVVGAPERDLCDWHIRGSSSGPYIYSFDCDEPADARTYVVFGPIEEDGLLADADVILEDTIWDGRLGTSLDTATDLNGDGWSDLLVTAPSGRRVCSLSYTWYAHDEWYTVEYEHPYCPEESPTRAFAVMGPLEPGIRSIDDRAVLIKGLRGYGATSIHSLGDIDGDGLDDFAVLDRPSGGPGYHVFSGGGVFGAPR